MGELYNHRLYNGVNEFHQIENKNFNTCIDYLEGKLEKKRNRYIGCKILTNQLKFISEDFPRYFIDSYKESYFIFLAREDVVKAYVSLRIAHMSYVWHTKRDKKVKLRKVNISPNELRSALDRKMEIRHELTKLFKDFDVKKIDLTYERLFSDVPGIIEKICAFLDITKEDIRLSKEIKGNPFKLEEMMENFEEVKTYFKQYPDYYKILLR